ncbi:MAG TPA: hypothetical protein VNJ03_14620, partial [Vicinamibacterales bacterium]|nr:hypothetical protein [Vicinamibacterales bacterium]
ADGSRIFYMSRAAEREALWSVGAAGGTSRVELQDVSAAAHAPGDRARVFLREKGDEAAFTQTLWVQAPIDSEPRRFATDWVGRETAGISFLHVSPDGTTVGLWANSRGGGTAGSALDSAEVWLFAFPSGQARRVLSSLGQMSRAHPFAWMPDSRRIVFGIDGLGRSPGTHLWIGDTASNRLEPLTPSATSEYEPAVSPNGERIAYTSGASDYDLLEIPLDGSAVRPKPSIDRAVADPSWSATGQEFAYITDRSGPQEIWRSDADGSLEVPVVTERNFSDETYLLSRVAFSPDGQRLAYQRRNRGGYYVWVSPVAGGPAIQLVSDAVAIYQDAPIWSPDGSWIAFTYRDRNGNRFLGKTRPGSGGEIVNIRGDIAFPAVPRWSPDGRWILCELPDGLYALSPDGGQERLVSRESWVSHTWSRSGSEVLAVRVTPDNRLQLAAIDFRTLAERIVTADLGPSPPATPPLRGFSLSPDGAHILTSVVRLRGDLYLFDGFAPPDGLWARVRDALGWRRVSRKPS